MAIIEAEGEVLKGLGVDMDSTTPVAGSYASLVELGKKMKED